VQDDISTLITRLLETLGKWSDLTKEAVFHAVYGSPVLQALAGLTSEIDRPRPKPGVSPDQLAALQEKIAKFRATMDRGGPLEAIARALIYIAKGEAAVDARSFQMLQRILAQYPKISLAQYKEAIRQQWAMLAIDESKAMATLPQLLPIDPAMRREMFEVIHSIRSAAGALQGEARRRLDEIAAIFGVQPPSTARAQHPQEVVK
jgi:hypothetical protein